VTDDRQLIEVFRTKTRIAVRLRGSSFITGPIPISRLNGEEDLPAADVESAGSSRSPAAPCRARSAPEERQLPRREFTGRQPTNATQAPVAARRRKVPQRREVRFRMFVSPLFSLIEARESQTV
jgi:hypothetical protein